MDPNTVTFHGQATALFRWLHGAERCPREVMLDGVVDSGKTFAWAHWIHTAVLMFPGAKILVLRETRVSLNEAFLATWEEGILGAGHPSMRGAKREHRTAYAFPAAQCIHEVGHCPRCADELDSYQPMEWWLALRLRGAGMSWPCQRCGTMLEVSRPEGDKPVKRASRVVTGGIDNKRRLYSTEWNVIYANEMTELALDSWEQLHRGLRRPGMPFWVLGGDCNPQEDTHWAITRTEPPEEGRSPRMQRLQAFFWDNPKITQEYVDRQFEHTTGVTRERMALGRWVRAEGAVWGDFRRQIHMIHAHVEKREHGGYTRYYLRRQDEDKAIRLYYFLAALDWGHHAPGCLGLWGFDGNETMYEVAECYHTGWDLDQWAEMATKMYKRWPFVHLICDHDPAAIKLLNDRLGPYCGRDLPAVAVRWEKRRLGKETEKAGIDVVRRRFRNVVEGNASKPGIYFLHANRWGPVDPSLREKRRPTCTVEEIPGWVYPVTEEGKPVKDEPDPSCPDHGCDMTRAVGYWAWAKDLKEPEPKRKYEPRELGSLLGHEEVLGERG